MTNREGRRCSGAEQGWRRAGVNEGAVRARGMGCHDVDRYNSGGGGDGGGGSGG